MHALFICCTTVLIWLCCAIVSRIVVFCCWTMYRWHSKRSEWSSEEKSEILQSADISVARHNSPISSTVLAVILLPNSCLRLRSLDRNLTRSLTCFFKLSHTTRWLSVVGSVFSLMGAIPTTWVVAVVSSNFACGKNMRTNMSHQQWAYLLQRLLDYECVCNGISAEVVMKLDVNTNWYFTARILLGVHPTTNICQQQRWYLGRRLKDWNVCMMRREVNTLTFYWEGIHFSLFPIEIQAESKIRMQIW